MSLSDLDGHYDAVVVGGGPAGAVSATLLARHGWRTLLVDKGPTGRSKCCGHCLNPRTIQTLDRLGLKDAVHSVKIGSTLGVMVHTNQSAPVRWSFGDATGWVTPRGTLDAALQSSAAGAGACVLNQSKARVVAIGAARSEIAVRQGSESRVLSASLVVGADGLNSAVARSAGLISTRRVGRKYGFSATIQSEQAQIEDEGWVHMFVSQAGYLGVVRDGESGLHLAALVNPKRHKKIKAPAAFVEHMRERFESCEALLGAGRLESIHAAGPMPWRLCATATPGVALVGDAAGYIEPFTGEGVFSAIEGAALLGRVAGNAEIGFFGLREARQLNQLWLERLGGLQRRCRWVAKILEHPGVFGNVMRMGFVRTNIERRVVRAIMGGRGHA